MSLIEPEGKNRPKLMPGGDPGFQERAALSAMERQACGILATRLESIHARHPGYFADVRQFALEPTSIKITVAIRAPEIWTRVVPTKQALEKRIETALRQRYPGRIEVEVSEGSLTITMLFVGLEAAKFAYETVKSVWTIAEYTVRCLEQHRLSWPPIESMFTFFESLKRIFLGV